MWHIYVCTRWCALRGVKNVAGDYTAFPLIVCVFVCVVGIFIGGQKLSFAGRLIGERV